MRARRIALVTSIVLASASTALTQAAVAQASGPATPSVSASDQYILTVADPTLDVQVPDLLDLAASSDLKLKTIAFSGDSGVGQLEVVPGEPAESLAGRAAALFEGINAELPPIVGATVSSSSDSVPREIDAGGISVKLQPVDEDAALTPSLPADGLRPHGTAKRQPTPVAPSAPAAAVANDWPGYFPAEWRTEGYNLNRCTYYANSQCWTWAQRATLTQSVKWAGAPGSQVSWGFSDWGFEFGVTLINPAMCNSATLNQGWWLGSNYSEWATNVPSSAGPYVEGNRLFDACQNMSHEVGIRDPQLLIAGYMYSFTISAPRNTAQTTTNMSAAYQVLHDDCLPGVALTDCMGLNTTINWPYSTHQSEIVVNKTRLFKMPGCVRMYDSWAAPIRWANGTSRLLPSPLSFSDSCFSNDY